MDTLVLSCSYQPVDRISWQRAICLWVLEKVEVLEEYEDREVISARDDGSQDAVRRSVSAPHQAA